MSVTLINEPGQPNTMPRPCSHSILQPFLQGGSSSTAHFHNFTAVHFTPYKGLRNDDDTGTLRSGAVFVLACLSKGRFCECDRAKCMPSVEYEEAGKPAS